MLRMLSYAKPRKLFKDSSIFSIAAHPLIIYFLDKNDLLRINGYSFKTTAFLPLFYYYITIPNVFQYKIKSFSPVGKKAEKIVKITPSRNPITPKACISSKRNALYIISPTGCISSIPQELHITTAKPCISSKMKRPSRSEASAWSFNS